MQMKCLVVPAFVLVALVTEAFPVLRPLFVAKTAAPTNGALVMIGDKSVLRSDRAAPGVSSGRAPAEGEGLVVSAKLKLRFLCQPAETSELLSV